jgi:hypothetical protein
LPSRSEKQLYALKTLEEAAKKLALYIILEPGDIQLLCNEHVLHARTAYKDYPAGSVDEDGKEERRRHLTRLWLATLESEGGWKVLFHDSDEKKRGGIQLMIMLLFVFWTRNKDRIHIQCKRTPSINLCSTHIY